jgi:hypothetical protein
MSVVFKSPPTVGSFMLSQAFIRFIIGPVGSGKSVGCIMELLRRAREQVPNSRGVRQTRFAVVRNTLQQLRQTCLADIEMWLKPILNFRVTDQTVQIRLKLPDGTSVESDWLLIPLDTPEDQKRLLSLNLTGAWISEFREIPLKVVDGVVGRLGRYPAKAIAPLTWHGLIGESNPPDEDSEWYARLELDRPPNWEVFKQPGGMEPNAENRDSLPSDYYENLVANNTPDWVDVHVHAKYGKSLSGQSVWRASFRPDFHLSRTPLKAIAGTSLMIGQDFGRTPASLITQVDVFGRLLILGEMTTVDMGIEQFVISKLRPLLMSGFTGLPTYMVGDPTGRYKQQVGEESPFDVLKRLGMKIYPAPTNDLEPRLRAVEQLFLRQVNGGAAILIDAAACPLLVQALKFSYRYKRKKAGELEDAPVKDHPWSDLADCLQYAALGVNGNYIGGLLSRQSAKVRSVRPNVSGWT